MSFEPKSLGENLPPSIPLVIHKNYEWSVDKKMLIDCKQDEEDAGGEIDAHQPQLKVVKEALDVLRSINKPLAVLSICGPFRTGKSYLLSRILGSPGAFKVGHAMSACTRGVWMATTILECEDFAVLLLDTEGMDSYEEDEESGVVNKLLTVTTLLSSFMIYNCSGVPGWDDLEDLSCFAQLSSSFVCDTVDDYDRISDSFPDFLWLIRDLTVQLPQHENEDRPLSPTEYLKKKVLVRSNKPVPSNEDCVVNAIYRLFPTISCRTLPRPSADPTVITSMEDKHDELDLKFKAELQKLLDYLLSSDVIKMKRFSTGQSNDGNFLAEYILQLVSRVNSGGALKLESTYLAAAELALSKLSQKLISEYKTELKARLKGRLPIEEYEEDADKESLLKFHKEVVAPKMEKFVKETGHFFPVLEDASVREKVKSLKSSFMDGICILSATDDRIEGGALFRFALENAKESRKFCQQLESKVFSSVRQKIHDALVKRSTVEISDDLLLAERKYYKKARGPAKNEIYEEVRKSLEEMADLCSRVPGRPMNLLATQLSKNQITLKWNGSNTSFVHHYQIQMMYGLEKWKELPEKYFEESAVIEKLKSNTDYCFQVRAIATSEIVGNWSDTCRCGTTLGIASRGALTLGSFIFGMAASPVAGMLVAGPPGAIGGLLASPALAGTFAKTIAKRYGPKQIKDGEELPVEAAVEDRSERESLASDEIDNSQRSQSALETDSIIEEHDD